MGTALHVESDGRSCTAVDLAAIGKKKDVPGETRVKFGVTRTEILANLIEAVCRRLPVKGSTLELLDGKDSTVRAIRLLKEW
jgi:hypothetical protein